MPNILRELFDAFMVPPCQGCGERYPLKEQQVGYVIPREGGHVEKVHYCPTCWEIVDTADPVTGAYGAAACDVRRATPQEIAHYHG